MNHKRSFIITLSLLFSFVFFSLLFSPAMDMVYANGEADEGSRLASGPNDCQSDEVTVPGTPGMTMHMPPRNCVFLEEPIGGKQGYDLYVITCTYDPNIKRDNCTYTKWGGEYVPPSTASVSYRGPVQAILSETPDRPYQGPFGLLYGYLGLVYGYMSGLIVGIAVLFVVVGGIQMITAGGDQGKFEAGRGRIIKAIVGIILWFTASLILYTINPTFFAF